MLVERAKKNQRLYFRQKATPMGGQINDSIDTDGRTNKWLDVQCICSDHCNKKGVVCGTLVFGMEVSKIFSKTNKKIFSEIYWKTANHIK